MSKRILIADDSVLMRMMISDCLEEDGWEVVAQASDGQQAIDLYRQHRPDATTMDIVMPGTDGIFALRKIREFDPEARVVVVSALNQTKMISEAIRAGAYDFIPKPFMPEQLTQTMNTCVNSEVAV